MTPDEFVKAAQADRLLSDLEPRQLKKLLPLAEERRFEANEIVFLEGARSAFLYFIVQGEVALELESDGPDVRVQTLRPGEAMGWSSLTENRLTHFQARALTPAATVAFPAEKLRAACERDPGLGYALMKRLLEIVTERLDAARLQLLSLRRHTEEPPLECPKNHCNPRRPQ